MADKYGLKSLGIGEPKFFSKEDTEIECFENLRQTAYSYHRYNHKRKKCTYYFKCRSNKEGMTITRVASKEELK